jgi:hypothetical protein
MLENQQRFSAGRRHYGHLDPRLNGDNFLPNLYFNTKLRQLFELGWRWVALTYTAIRYRYAFDGTLSASSVGAAVSFTFPNAPKRKL